MSKSPRNGPSTERSFHIRNDLIALKISKPPHLGGGLYSFDQLKLSENHRKARFSNGIKDSMIKSEDWNVVATSSLEICFEEIRQSR